ncbi:MAG TPA: NADP-specific glutamate dehydrogenase, partial [candidate division Zixibacteria bacterium]|nr:NADP-specific glutamate dehydrogenase [candidate division Zixibacteria bacterium]
MSTFIASFIGELRNTHPGQPEFHQAVYDTLLSAAPALERTPAYQGANILGRIVEPERVVIFRVPWVDDGGRVRVNRGYRVEFSSALGPYKGGLRFHPGVNLGVMKFLAFEQTLKNSLTTLPLGGAKGGSDFDTKGRSEGEVMRFCQSFMNELFRHLGPRIDIIAGDIGVERREIGFLFGQYKRLRNAFDGAVMGKAVGWGGTVLRPEATGYGCAYFAAEMLATRDESFAGKRVAISGAGTVALHAAEKVVALGGRVVAMSDSHGFVVDEAGIEGEKLAFLAAEREGRRGTIREYADRFSGVSYSQGPHIWHVPVDIAMPCATQNEMNTQDAAALIANGCRCVCEGATMPVTADASRVLQEAGILYGPGKAANAGAAVVSAFETAQNASGLVWSAAAIDRRLRAMMAQIHR